MNYRILQVGQVRRALRNIGISKVENSFNGRISQPGFLITGPEIFQSVGVFYTPAIRHALSFRIESITGRCPHDTELDIAIKQIAGGVA